MIPLLRPLKFQGPLIPILSDALENMLLAPVPIIAGIPKLSIQVEGVVVDLDNNKVSFTNVEDIPRLPESKKM